MARNGNVQVRRAYDEPLESDGTRVLVDRVWPRGLRKDAAHFDQWCKQVAPSTALRTWYQHDPEKWPEFEARYRAELSEGEAAYALAELRELAKQGPLTLITASKRDDISQASVLAKLLTDR